MRTPRGTTLVELLVAMVVSSIAITGILLMIQAQQRTFHTGGKSRQAQQNGRSALLYVEQRLALAGFGMDPALALDFTWYRCPAGPASCPRDYTNAPDELVFYYRSPMARLIDGDALTPTQYFGNVWQANVITGSVLTLEARGGETFAKGQIFQITCKDEFRYTHVTLSTTHANVPPGPVELELEPVYPSVLAAGVPADPFRRQDAADPLNAEFKKWNRCLSVTPRAFRVERNRFYVRPVALGDGRVDPYLVLDQGIDTDADGDVDVDDELLIADGVENFQVSYAFLNPALAPVGTVPGTTIAVPAPGAAADAVAQTITPTNFPGAYDSTKEFPLFKSSQFFTSSTYTAANPLLPPRLTNDQGNIRSVNIALVARSPEPDPSGFSNLGYGAAPSLMVMNFNQPPPWITSYLAAHNNQDRYMRAVLTTSVGMPNMAARGLAPN